MRILKFFCWIFGLAMGVIGGVIVYNCNLNFEELLPKWFIIVSSLVPVIVSIAAIVPSTWYLGPIEPYIFWSTLWDNIWAFLKILLIVAVSVVVLLAIGFLWALIADAVQSGAWFLIVLMIAALTAGGGGIIVIIFGN